MFSPPILSQFRFYFPHNFFYKNVIEIGNEMIRDHLPYEHIADYINTTVYNCRIPGLNDDGTDFQIYDKGNKTKTYKGSKDPKETVTKTLSVEFELTNNYSNWFMWYIQTLEFLSLDNENTYLPNVYTQVMGDDSQILIEVVYKDIRITSLSDVELTTRDNGIINKTFTLDLAFNEFEMIPHYTNKLNPRRNAGRI